MLDMLWGSPAEDTGRGFEILNGYNVMGTKRWA